MDKLLHKKLFLCLLFLISINSRAQVLFSESFSNDSLPAGWTNDSLGFPGNHLWIFDNQFNRSITGAGFDAHFAIFDSDEGSVNDNVDENASLTTPLIDISTSTNLFLELDQHYRQVLNPGGSWRSLKVSVDSGATWIVLDSSETNLGYPNAAVHTSYDLTSHLPANSLQVRFQFYGSWDWWWAIDNVEVINVLNCTGAPNAGTAHASMTTVCSHDTISLTLIGEDPFAGMQYQWQSSPDGTNWTDIAGDTLPYSTKVQLTPTHYRCALACSSQTSYSIPVFVDMGIPDNCYCVGVFATGCDILDKVVFNTLSNVNSGCNGNPNNYILYPDTGLATTTVYADSTYDITIASGAGSGNHGAAVWFDFDRNGDFRGANEFFHISDSIPENSADFITSVTIPANAFGTTRMKVRYVYSNPVVQSSDCADYTFGETEDYSIYIMNPTINIETILAAEINVFPSPATDILKITTGQLIGSKTFSLFDRTGRLSMKTISSSSYFELNVGELAGGIYFLRVDTDKGSVTKKVVIN